MPLPGRPLYLAFLPDFLFRTDAVPARYLVRAWLLALVPSLLLSILVGLLLPQAKGPDIPMAGAFAILMVILIGPFIETLLMILPLLGLNRLLGPGPAVIGSAALWGVAHSLAVPVWGLVIWWPFLILSIAFLTWREKGIPAAILVVTAIHGLQNSVGVAIALSTGPG